MIQKIQKLIINNYKWVICFLCIILFLVLAEDVFTHEIMNGDIIGYNLISKYLIKDNITPIMKIITFYGGAIFLVSLTILLFIIIKNKKIGIIIGTNLVTITPLNQLFKFILQRPRPTEYRIINEVGYSFPSGHSITSMVFYGYLVYLTYKYINNKKIKIPLIIFLVLLIPTIGLSRIYLGVHYASDVLCGFLLGIIYLILFISISKKYLEKK